MGIAWLISHSNSVYGGIEWLPQLRTLTRLNETGAISQAISPPPSLGITKATNGGLFLGACYGLGNELFRPTITKLFFLNV
jgi:hypothetical protein